MPFPGLGWQTKWFISPLVFLFATSPPFSWVSTAVITPGSFFSQYMRMMGLHPTIHFLSWFLENMATLALSSAALAVILKMSGIFMHSDAFIIFLYLLDFGVSAVMMSYFLSVFFNQANTAALCTSLGYMISFLPYVVLLVLHNQLSFAIQTLLVSKRLCKNAQ